MPRFEFGATFTSGKTSKRFWMPTPRSALPKLICRFEVSDPLGFEILVDAPRGRRCSTHRSVRHVRRRRSGWHSSRPRSGSCFAAGRTRRDGARSGRTGPTRIRRVAAASSAIRRMSLSVRLYERAETQAAVGIQRDAVGGGHVGTVRPRVDRVGEEPRAVGAERPQQIADAAAGEVTGDHDAVVDVDAVDVGGEFEACRSDSRRPRR